jgi:inhibitor of KinA sporulation pathway (predicted exonuclease)
MAGQFSALSKLPTIYVLPTESEISEFCTRLTGITPDTAVSLGIPFEAACRNIRRAAHSITWASWGDYDRTMFESQCKRRMIRYPFSETHINAKRMVQHLTGQRMGMDRALEFFGLSLEGRHHDGGDDAYNIARIIRHCFTTEPYAGRVRESLALARTGPLGWDSNERVLEPSG